HVGHPAHPEDRSAEATGARRRLHRRDGADSRHEAWRRDRPLRRAQSTHRRKEMDVPLTDLPSSAGMLATAGGIVFTGKLTGEFLALDAATGKTLWQFQT